MFSSRPWFPPDTISIRPVFLYYLHAFSSFLIYNRAISTCTNFCDQVRVGGGPIYYLYYTTGNTRTVVGTADVAGDNREALTILSLTNCTWENPPRTTNRERVID